MLNYQYAESVLRVKTLDYPVVGLTHAVYHPAACSLSSMYAMCTDIVQSISMLQINGLVAMSVAHVDWVSLETNQKIYDGSNELVVIHKIRPHTRHRSLAKVNWTLMPTKTDIVHPQTISFVNIELTDTAQYFHSI